MINPKCLRVVNTTAVVDFGQSLNLSLLAKLLQNTSSDSSNIKALKIKRPGLAILLFGSGKSVITGCRTRIAALRCAKTMASDLREHGHESAHVKSFRITNIVHSGDLVCGVDLVKFYNDYKPVCSYECELFPGLFYKPVFNHTVLIFTSGKFIVTGFKNFVNARKFSNDVFTILLNYPRIKC